MIKTKTIYKNMTKYIVVVNWQSKKLGELHTNMLIEAKNEVDAFEIAIGKIKKHKRYLKWIETSLVCEQLLK